MEMYDVIVLGGGASGMTAAIFAKTKENTVAILEKNADLGKKILTTGNGRCNFTNAKMEVSAYHHNENVVPVLHAFSHEDTLSFFSRLGILYHEREGYFYPRNNQALCVRERMKAAVLKSGVKVFTDTNVTEVTTEPGGFCIKTKDRVFHCRALIVCCGGTAYPQGGNTGFGYEIAKQMHHSIIPCVPALVPLFCRENFYKEIKGVRAFGEVRLFVDQTLVASDVGEIQFTKSGISGIPVFNISRHATRGLYEKKQVRAELDFFCDYEKKTFCDLMQSQKERAEGEDIAAAFSGMIHDKLLHLLLQLSCKKNRLPKTLDQRSWDAFVNLCKHFPTEIVGSADETFAQVTCGGIPFSEVTKDLESTRQKGLYFAGEVLDADAICGGYNLQWAFSSGYVAGTHAAKGTGL